MGRQNIDKVAFLAQCSIFTGLPQWELKSIAQLMRLIEYRKDEIIYREGAPGSSFYVVVSGRFEAAVSENDKKKVLAYLRRGDYFGEMSLLTQEPHSATMKSLSDSLVLELKKEDFERTIAHNATISFELSRRLSARLRGDSRSRLLLRSDVISIFSSQHQIGRTAFSINLAASLIQETHQKTVLLDMSPSGHEISAKLHMAEKIPLTQFHNIENESTEALSNFLVKHPVGFEVLSVAHQENDSVGEQIIIPLLNHLSINFRFILIDLPGEIDEMVYRALSQSDSIYFVTDSHVNNITETRETIAEIEKDLSIPEDRIGVVVNEVLLGIRTTSAVRRELFGKKVCYSLPSTPELKEHEASGMMPFVVGEPEADYSRVVRHIARRISNNLVGLVLGSGAALGLAHIGVLRVLEKEKIPVDMVSGSSIGSLVAALFATGRTADEIEKAAMEMNSWWRFSNLLDISLYPVRGLLNGKKIMRHYGAHLGDKTFEDCHIPLKIAGANLSTWQVMMFDSGPILPAIRASIAIPAIFKPIRLSADWVVDGGILDPLPIRALHEAGANKIIAVNVFPTKKDIIERRIMNEQTEERELQSLQNRSALVRAFHKIGRYLHRRFVPNVFDILMNTIQAMEAEIAEVEGESADVLVRPVVPTASWVEFYRPEVFIRRGEEEAEKMLPKIKALVSLQNV